MHISLTSTLASSAEVDEATTVWKTSFMALGTPALDIQRRSASDRSLVLENIDIVYQWNETWLSRAHHVVTRKHITLIPKA
jgi:hypothetical protein